MTSQSSPSNERRTPVLSGRMRYLVAASSVTLFAFMLLSVYLSPFAYMVVTAFKNRAQITDPKEPIFPLSAVYTYTGEEVTHTYVFADKEGEVTIKPDEEFDLYEVEKDGKARQLAQLSKWEFAELLGRHSTERHYDEQSLQEDMEFADGCE